MREKARYAIVAVDGTVRRVYRPDPDRWTPSGAKWQFTGTTLPHEQVQELAGPGELPLRIGDPCPAKPGGACRPLWF